MFAVVWCLRLNQAYDIIVLFMAGQHVLTCHGVAGLVHGGGVTCQLVPRQRAYCFLPALCHASIMHTQQVSWHKECMRAYLPASLYNASADTTDCMCARLYHLVALYILSEHTCRHTFVSHTGTVFRALPVSMHIYAVQHPVWMLLGFAHFTCVSATCLKGNKRDALATVTIMHHDDAG